MPRKRIIGGLIVKGGIVQQSLGFERYLPVGKPEIAARFFDSWGIDEIVVVDIEASGEGRFIDPDLVGRVSQSCFVPVAAGGGIRTVDEIRRLLAAGADKVVINTAAIEDPAFVAEASRVFGAQCIVASVDVKRRPEGGFGVFKAGGRVDTSGGAAETVAALEQAGAGEILLTSIDRDGARSGYDIELYESVAGDMRVPLIACAGAGSPTHIRDVLAIDGVSAAAAANFLHYSEHSVSQIKSWLRNRDSDVRGEDHAVYRHFGYGDDGRIGKLPEDVLLDQMFEYVEEEII